MTTVPASTRTTTYTLASASAGPFLVGFRIFDETLIVKVNGAVRTDYTVAATFVGGYTDSASITFDDDLAIADVVVIDGDMPISRGAEYLNPDPSLTTKINIEMGRVWAALQQIGRDTSRDAAALALIAGGVVGAVGVQAYGAAGDGTLDDSAAFTAALAATTGPVYVPWTASYYPIASLSAADRKRLYGPGDVWVAGTKTFISTDPFVGNDDGHLRAFNHDWSPSKWSSVDGSLYAGAGGFDFTRVGGFGTYGLFLTNLAVSAATPAGQFDVGMTAWATHRNLTGGDVFGAWFGGNTPASALGQVYTAGSGNGAEINVGPRGNYIATRPDDIGNTRDIVCLRLVPDVVPSSDGPAYEAISNITIATPGVLTRVGHGYRNGLAGRIYANTGTLPTGFTNGGLYYIVNVTTDTFQLSATFGGTGIATSGTFAAGVAFVPSYSASAGLAILNSNNWHQFWNGIIVSADAVVPGGMLARLRGGGTLGQAPLSGIFMDGYVETGVDLSTGIYTSNKAVYLGSAHRILWAGNAALSSTSSSVDLTTGNADADGALKSNAGALTNFAWDGTGGVTRIGFNGTSPIAKPTVTGSRGANAALASLCTQLAALGLITDSTS